LILKRIPISRSPGDNQEFHFKDGEEDEIPESWHYEKVEQRLRKWV